VLAFNYLTYGLTYLYASKIVAKYGIKKAMPLGLFLNILYAATYIFPVGCAKIPSTTGLCHYGFTGTLIMLFALVGGPGLAVYLANQIIDSMGRPA
jgi:hypothetical protein